MADSTQPSGLPQPFPGTQWSLVARAGHGTEATRRDAMEVLLRRYLGPMRAHLVLDKAFPPDWADDLLQGFATDKIVGQNLLARADHNRGRFRNFLLTALDRYAVDRLRAEATDKRGPSHAAGLDLQGLECADPGPGPSGAFDFAWAQEVIVEAVGRTREYCQAVERPAVWGVLWARVLAPAMEGAEPAAYERLVAEFGLRSPAHACNVLTTGKRLFARVLRSVVGEYVEEADVEDDINDLYSALARGATGG